MKTITVASLRADALAAYKAGTLIAQNPSPDSSAMPLVSRCGKYTCGVGASIPPASRAYLGNENISGYLGSYPDINYGVVVPANLGFRDPIEDEMRDLAGLHDVWAAATDPETRAQNEERFLAQVSRPVPWT